MKLPGFKQSDLTGILYFMLRSLHTLKPQSVVALGYNGNRDHLAQFHREAHMCKKGLLKLFHLFIKADVFWLQDFPC